MYEKSEIKRFVVNVLSYFASQIWLEMSKLPFIPLINTFTLIIYGYILNNISNIPNYQ